MGVTISVVPIGILGNKPSQLIDINNLTKAVMDAMYQVGIETKNDLNKTTATWKTHKVSFENPVMKNVGGEISCLVYADDPDNIYNWLDQGTKVRRARLSKDWVSKTSPGVLGSTAGAGRVVAVNKKFQYKGIEARKFLETAEGIYAPKMALTINAVIGRIVV